MGGLFGGGGGGKGYVAPPPPLKLLGGGPGPPPPPSTYAYGLQSPRLDPVLRQNAWSAQPMSGPVFSLNSGFASLDQVLG